MTEADVLIVIILLSTITFVLIFEAISRHYVPKIEGDEEVEERVGNTLISLRNSYGKNKRWTDLSVQEVALRIRNSEVVPLTNGEWLSPWNIDTFISKDKLAEVGTP